MWRYSQIECTPRIARNSLAVSRCISRQRVPWPVLEVTAETMRVFLETLDIPADDKAILMKLSPGVHRDAWKRGQTRGGVKLDSLL